MNRKVSIALLAVLCLACIAWGGAAGQDGAGQDGALQTAGISPLPITPTASAMSAPVGEQPAPVAGQPAPVIAQAAPAAVTVQTLSAPGIYTTLAAKLNLPLAQVQKLSDAAVENLIEQNAAKLRLNVYRLQGGELKLTAAGGSASAPRVLLNPYVAGAASLSAADGASLDGASEDAASLDEASLDAAQPDAAQPDAAQPDGALAPAAAGSRMLYVPYVTNALPPDGFITAIQKAYQYLFRVSSFESSYGYVKEYVGYPLWIRNGSRAGDGTYPRLVGHYYQNFNQPLGKITYYAVGYDYDLMHVTFEEGYDWNYGSPTIWADRYYTADNMRYEVSVRSFSGSENVALYLQDYQVWTRGETLPKTMSYTLTDGLAAHRYTIRHAVMLGQKIYDANNQVVQRTRLETTAGAFSFYRDLYDPLFGERTFLEDDFMFLDTAFHDCDLKRLGVQSDLFWGVYPNMTSPQFTRYGYESKVCVLGRSAYIALARQDYLGPALQAIHILNKYGSADHQYVNPNYPANGLPWMVTPRQTARWLETNGWNGYGIKIWGKDAAYASGVRTNAFLVLETLLGYKYGDGTSAAFADNAARVLLSTQWGVDPNRPGAGQTSEDGVVLRPQFRGGQLLAWVQMSPLAGASYKYKAVNYGYGLPPRTILSDLIDLFSMPTEVEGVLPTNSESTLTFIQALRVYVRYKYGLVYPNGSWIP